MNKLKSVLQGVVTHWWAWALLGLPVAALILYLTVSSVPEHIVTEAAPPTEKEVTFDMEVNKAYTADDGLIVIKPEAVQTRTLSASVEAGSAAAPATVDYTPEKVWEQDTAATYNNFTMPEKAEMQDGSLGVLIIPKLGVSANVFETDNQMEDMSHGVAHFKSTSAWEGNIGLSAHNVNFDLTDGYFKNLFLLGEGDEIVYSTQLGERRYSVTTVAEIADDDWSYLGRTEDNRITLITCISGKPAKRLCVQAMEKK